MYGIIAVSIRYMFTLKHPFGINRIRSPFNEISVPLGPKRPSNNVQTTTQCNIIYGRNTLVALFKNIIFYYYCNGITYYNCHFDVKDSNN